MPVQGQLRASPGRNTIEGAGAGRPSRVLLVEDEPSISEPFAQALAREGFRTVVAGNASEARQALAAGEPDIVLLDLMLPDADGRDLIRELRADSHVPIIMLTARATRTDRIVGLELGADDYVVKPFDTAEVIARIRALLRRAREPIVTCRLTAGEVSVDISARRAWRGKEELTLTRKEFDLLARLLAEPGRVVTREDLMCDVWDENWFGSTKTLDVHLAALRRKLGDDPAGPRFIQTVRGVGYRFVPGDGEER